jgi:para-nitrobenzyl esterase
MIVRVSIQTCAGLVEGKRSAGVRCWLGIPFAKAERFGLPQPPTPWSGVRAATRFGPECPQFFASMAAAKKLDSSDVSEDCLVLNVWAPDSADTTLKPVMVWIHGGAFMAGTGNLYDGSGFAARGDMVVVTINYRLGVLGFVNLGEALELPQIASNLGMRDQTAALEWVRDNIAAFGGDPSRVTVAGESAGSIAISLLMLYPRAWPLFRGAIMQSGAISLPHSHEKSLRIAHRYREILGLEPGNLARLRALNRKTLLRAHAQVQELERGTVPAGPWYDADLFPASMALARVAPTAHVPLLAGFNRDEIRTFELMRGSPILPTTRAANELLLRQQMSPAAAEQVLSAYADSKRDNRTLATHLTFGMPTLHFAERHSRSDPTWFYRFDYSHPLIGAAHALELTFVWKFEGFLAALMRGGPLIGKRRALADRMKRHWAHFVIHGRADTDWPAYTIQHRPVRLFDLEDRTENDPDKARRHAWNGADVSTSIAAA